MAYLFVVDHSVSSFSAELHLKEQKRRERLTERAYGATKRGETDTMSDDTVAPQPSASDGYVSLVAHIWVGENGKLIRGTIEDVHTGTRLALDLSELVAFLQASLAHSPGHASDAQYEGEEGMTEEQQRERPGEGPSDAGH